ncbi:MAG: type IV conjugative transfer system coupling protein TraD [Burkholderiales bacterium]|nr:type IV conjugative transfer system coupling protein TraD [Burkholderiales bacterium]
MRPAYELCSAAVAVVCAIAVTVTPRTFLLPQGVAWAMGAVCLLLAAVRTVQGCLVIRYRWNLRRQREYVVTSDEIPWSEDRLFLGKGFRWDQRHTQRLHEARLPHNQDLLKPGVVSRIVDLFQSPSTAVVSVGGDPAIHGVEPRESDTWMEIGDRVGHTLVLGTTRVGKTRLAELLITQDIRRGEVVIVFDPKGDLDLLRRVYAEAKRAGRVGQLFMFHLGHPELSARYNPVGNFSRITEVATRIAGQLPSEGQSAAFKEFVWRFVNVMARALVALGRKPDYEQINRYASNVEPLLVDYFEHWFEREPAAAGWREELESMAIDKKSLAKGLQTRGARAVTLVEYARRKKLYDPIAHALASTLNYEKSYFDKLVASLLPLMEKLTTGRTASLLSPVYDDLNDWRPVFDWTSVINLGGIVYVGLDALSDYEVAAAVGNSMFADLTSVAGSLYKFGTGHGLPGEMKSRRIAIHADEFNELIGDEFIPLLNKAGGAGFQVTAYTQTWSDVEARIGSRAKAGQIAGNFNTLIMLRVKEMATAELLTDQLPEVRVVSTVVASSVTDNNDPADFADFSSRNEDRILTESAPMLAPSDLVQLPKGQAFALIHGGLLHKIRMPLPDASHDPMMPESIAAIGRELKSLTGVDIHRKPAAVTEEGKGIGF